MEPIINFQCGMEPTLTPLPWNIRMILIIDQVNLPNFDKYFEPNKAYV